MATECTNVGSNAYYLAREFRLPAQNGVAAAWIASFFVVRILPVPYLTYVYYTTLLAGACLNAAERAVGIITVPIPRLPINLSLITYHPYPLHSPFCSPACSF